MKRQRLFSKNRRTKLAILAITLATLLGVNTYSPLAATPWKVASVDLPGASGVSNNVALAYDRYVMIAPYASSKAVEDNHDLSQLDNCYVYLIDTKKPSEGPQRVKLAANDSTDSLGKVVFYPSRVLFDSDSSTVFVRGTRYEERDGELIEVEALAYLRLNLDDNGKPVFSSTVVVIDIKGSNSDQCSDAPLDFALAHKGSLLLFTNGASIFSYNIGQGYVYKVDIVPSESFNEDSKISYLDIDKATDTLIVCWNKKEKGEDGAVKTASQLSFYAIYTDGTLGLKKRALAHNFVDGTALTAGSTVAVTSTLVSTKDHGDQLVADNAYFVTNDGSLCQIDLGGDDIPENVKQLRKFEELAQPDSVDGSPRIVKYDAAKRVIGIVKKGFTAEIRRPSNGRPGRRGSIVRALGVYNPVEQPAFALVKLGKKNKIISSQVFVDGFKNEDGLSNFVYGDDSQWLVSTHSGKLFSLSLSNDPADTQIRMLAEIGSRIDYIEYFGTRGSVIAISSFESDEEGVSIKSPGSLVVARMGDLVSQSQSFSAMVLQGAGAHDSVLATAAPSIRKSSIRRPCNVKN
jgi:hypothetical protein